MMSVLENKQSAHLQYISLPNSKNLQTLKRCKKESSVNRQKMFKRILGWTHSKHSICCKSWKYSWNVRRHQESLFSIVIYWSDKSTHIMLSNHEWGKLCPKYPINSTVHWLLNQCLSTGIWLRHVNRPCYYHRMKFSADAGRGILTKYMPK